MKVATWNVNSIKARLPLVLAWLRQVEPDVVLFQETKVPDGEFPVGEIGDLGYNIAAAGQKTYNGVAVISKRPIDLLAACLPGDPDDREARYIEAFTGGVRVASIYAPNGNPVGGERFPYKLAWLRRLYRHMAAALEDEDAAVFAGDYNVAPTDGDVYDPRAWRDDALCQPASRAGYRRLLHLGYLDAVRALSDRDHQYTWWDYRRRCWPADRGLRIDHMLLSPQAADALTAVGIDREPRGWERASDHTPVWCELAVSD
ncbi:MAG: exodeoxyribonuclease III [Rhodospirillales bacterium]|nr:exodeoxyribonuclease III [Rhodospirillales bacterium]